MRKQNFAEAVDELVKQDPQYDRDAYYFVRESLDFTIKMLKKNGQTGSRHVSGQELLDGLRRFALEQFGPMAKTVLTYWGVKRCEDFGEIVFRMVDKGVLGKTEQDSREDFKGGYDFDEAFVKPFLPAERASGDRTKQAGSAGGELFRGKGRASSSDKEKLSSGPN